MTALEHFDLLIIGYGEVSLLCFNDTTTWATLSNQKQVFFYTYHPTDMLGCHWTFIHSYMLYIIKYICFVWLKME